MAIVIKYEKLLINQVGVFIQALDHIHEKKIMHRDIKSSNLLVSQRLQVVLVVLLLPFLIFILNLLFLLLIHFVS